MHRREFGVDIGRANEPLHQLVGDVIVLDEQLARDVEGDAVGAMGGDRFLEPPGHEVQRFVPAGLDAVDDWREQPTVERQGLACPGR
jgi:hypothetical protein